ncbi:MAG TPA: hypothetical protein PLJ42_12265 [Chitinophagales bacterium]|nr:hypothetical protein [Chitinophagales bacterium]MBP6154008.1 hypothetical protein [Chitinophagales bacterium]HQV79307.1 hypothetical protein [Chitinophagales bacterium]HQW80199.1 hypothetical protein [Chitinophagales bacterium]
MQKLLFILLISFVTPIFAQQEMVKVKTKVIDENNNPIPFADVAFRRMQLGFSSDKEGNFSINMLKSDSVVIMKNGHVSAKLILKDSVSKDEYFVTVVLQRKPYELSEVQINAIKNYTQIRQQINTLSVKSTDLNPDARPFTNPLSYLYGLFSKHEKEKRVASQMETEEAKRNVLKELFKLYNSYKIIDLEEEEYDRFITYLNMPYAYLQQTSDYDLAVSIKRMYAGYTKDNHSSFRKQIYPAALDDMQFIKQQPNGGK